jgi:HAD superfamily hydrolase (TIGR01549 family)
LLALFDLDNTLINRDLYFGRFADRAATRWSAHDVSEAVAAIWRADEDALRPRDAFFADLKKRFRLPDSVDELRSLYDREMVQTIRLDDAVVSMLGRLRDSGFRIAVVSNGGVTQRRKVDVLGLESLVDACILSEEVGVRKPDPRILEIAAVRCDEPLAGSWMVGDRPDADIAAASAAGIRSVWVAGDQRWPAGLSFKPTVTVKTVIEAGATLLGVVRS